jgi:hypothetical protein
LKFDELEVRQRRGFGLEQQVTDLLITAATVDQHPNVPIEGLDHSEANLRPAVAQDSLQMLQVGQFLEAREPLPLQLVHPLLQVVEHRAFVAIVPELLQALFEKVGLEDTPAQVEQPV